MNPTLWILPAALVFLAGGAAAASHPQHHDAREVILLGDGERAKLLAEMRGHVRHGQGFLAPLLRGNCQAAAIVAQASGLAWTSEAWDHVAGRLPKAFTTRGLEFRVASESIADATARGNDERTFVGNPAPILQKNVSCHANYRVQRGVQRAPSR